jgi:hypothetical protein
VVIVFPVLLAFILVWDQQLAQLAMLLIVQHVIQQTEIFVLVVLKTMVITMGLAMNAQLVLFL